jgi:thioredoxin 1
MFSPMRALESLSRLLKSAATAALVVAAIVSTLPAQDSPQTAGTFTPFEQWKSAILSGHAVALKSFYSTDPAAQIRVNSVMYAADADTSFWLNLKPRSMKVSVVRNVIRHGHINYIFRAEVQPATGPAISITDDQAWLQQGDQWRLIYAERTDAPHLQQPADMNKNIYPADADAHAEIKEAEARASAAHKRLLLVFGANWCFDCHVLDLAFQRPDLAPVLVSNYELVHVDLGPDEEKNADIVRQFNVRLDKGIPVLAVAESDGRVVFTQRNGEFEDARRLTPEVLLAFLNKWKPEAQ